MRRVKLFAVIAVVSLSAEAQSLASSTTSSFFNHQIWAEGSSRSLWRGLDSGRLALRAGAARSWGCPDSGCTDVIIGAEAASAFVDRSETSDRIGAGVSILRRLNDDGLVWVAGEVLAFPSPDHEETTAQVELGAQIRAPVPWPGERRPWLIVEARRDLKRWETTYARAGIRFDYWLPWEGRYLMVDVGHAWSGIPPGMAAGSVDFSQQGTDVTITFLRQKRDTQTSSRSWEPFVSGVWSDRNSDRVLIVAGLRIVFTR